MRKKRRQKAKQENLDGVTNWSFSPEYLDDTESLDQIYIYHGHEGFK